MTDTSKTVVPRSPQKGSFQSLVLDLAPGESVCRVRPVDPTMTLVRVPEEMPALRQALRNAVTPAVTRAGKATGSTYTIEVGDLAMPGGNLYVAAVVTRTE